MFKSQKISIIQNLQPSKIPGHLVIYLTKDVTLIPLLLWFPAKNTAGQSLGKYSHIDGGQAWDLGDILYTKGYFSKNVTKMSPYILGGSKKHEK